MAGANHEQVAFYQDCLKQEKRTLLRIGGARQALAEHVERILEEGLFRSLKRETLRDIAAALRGVAAGDALERLLELPFYEQVWNKARAVAGEEAKSAATAEAAAWEQAFRETATARNRLLEEYAFLIPRVLRHYFHQMPAAQLRDLESEAVLGLFRALETFDPAKKGDLRIHVQTRILSTLMDYCKESEHTKARLAQEGLAESEEEATSEARAPRGLIANLATALHEEKRPKVAGAALISLDDPLPQAEDGHYADIIVGDEGNPFEIAEGRELLERLRKILASKPSLERFLIQAKWNLDEESRADAPPRAVADAAARMRSEAARRLREGLAGDST
jgi:DNA-directed RNA polymerase specialized sigma subunit